MPTPSEWLDAALVIGEFVAKMTVALVLAGWAADTLDRLFFGGDK